MFKHYWNVSKRCSGECDIFRIHRQDWENPLHDFDVLVMSRGMEPMPEDESGVQRAVVPSGPGSLKSPLDPAVGDQPHERHADVE